MKRRLNANKIAKQPKLKKDMALFVAKCEVRWGNKPDISTVDLLWKGHRGFISYSEKDLMKIFEKYHALVEQKYTEEKREADKENNDPMNKKYRYVHRVDAALEELYNLGSVVMDAMIDDILLI